MALKQTITKEVSLKTEINGNIIDNGVEEKEFSDMYIKIHSIKADKEKVKMSVSYAKDNVSYSEQIEIVTDEFIALAYTKLTTLDEFKDAVDC